MSHSASWFSDDEIAALTGKAARVTGRKSVAASAPVVAKPVVAKPVVAKPVAKAPSPVPVKTAPSTTSFRPTGNRSEAMDALVAHFVAMTNVSRSFVMDMSGRVWSASSQDADSYTFAGTLMKAIGNDAQKNNELILRRENGSRYCLVWQQQGDDLFIFAVEGSFHALGEEMRNALQVALSAPDAEDDAARDHAVEPIPSEAAALIHRALQGSEDPSHTMQRISILTGIPVSMLKLPDKLPESYVARLQSAVDTLSKR